jgi:hypothetical protein
MLHLYAKYIAIGVSLLLLAISALLAAMRSMG